MAGELVAARRLSNVAQDIFFQRGGVALGLHLAEIAAATELPIRTPRYRLIPFDLSPEELVAEVQTTARRFASGIALRYSGLQEAFSAQSRRGVNSTGLRYQYEEVLSGKFDRPSAAHLLASAPQGTIALILQEMIVLPDFIGLVHCYARSSGTTVEMRRPRGARLVNQTVDGAYHDESTGPVDFSVRDRENSAIESVLVIGSALYETVGFDLDIEGFWLDAQLVVIQLRPVPDDLPMNPDATLIVKSLQEHAWHRTRFVWGDFDTTGVLLPATSQTSSQIVSWTDSDRARGWSDFPMSFWRNAPVIVDTDSGFHLSHDQRLLPPAGTLRNVFRYISVAGAGEVAEIWGKRIRCVSDGEVGVVCFG
ncbi:hypothetical protein [Streptomyces sp. ME19-01-6]|uniref:hypothetical protein n=1 Tax=Streptomyces sp. ME19-01-6 TaxID=3028686 RepID=UPI0029A67E8E|nr:hypothetical protein [Streptomyces sp. ME19-01-6]MDX3225239.1 hypothetical protein [Streptomyces sp. ME19-01-6]